MLLGNILQAVGEARLYSIDYSKWLAEGEKLTGAFYTVDAGTATVSLPPTLGPLGVEDTRTLFILNNGTLGDQFNVVVNVSTNFGQTRNDHISCSIQTNGGPVFVSTNQQLMLSIVGPTGSAGSIGPAGSAGAAGTTGNTGPTGLSGPAGIASNTGATGPTGSSGPAGIASNTGATGPTGLSGLQGFTGNSGSTGPTGPTGSQGIQGIQGVQGSFGSMGSGGAQGAQGNTGPTGFTGAAGTLTGPTGAGGNAVNFFSGRWVGPTATSSQTTIMLGFGSSAPNAALTPSGSGDVFMNIDGAAVNLTAGDIINVQLYYGTGTAPVFNGGATGVALSSLQALGAVVTRGGFNLQGVASGLVVGTKYWMDLGISTAAATGNIYSADLVMYELGGGQIGATGYTGPTGPTYTYATGGTFTPNANFSGGTGAAAFLMSGIGATFTPKTTGKITVAIDGTIVDLAGIVGANNYIFGMYYGPTGGAAPANQVALTGIALGATQVAGVYAVPTAANVNIPFSLTRFVQGLTIGTVYWFDLATKTSVATDKFAIQNPQVTIVEYP